MAVAPVMGSANTGVKTKAATTADSVTGTSTADLMNNFMTLLVAQMQNQDPTNPMDNNQMTSQLAQFNTAAGVEQLNSTLNNVGTLVSSMQQMNAAEWVGRTVMVEGQPVVNNTDADGANKSFSFSLNSDADTVAVTLTDKEGNAYRGELKNVKAGIHSYSLDDISNFQPSAPPGGTSYSVSFAAANGDGDAPEIVSLKKAKVESVAFSSTGSVLQLGVDGTASLGDVYEIL
ncbi:flagellar basal-body rod modification protein FlgD [Enterobacter sp. BIGb0383]|uniref:flagellar hook assembly protein FlgD n=1 Tax=unclassified Enterobacter TaxID=2608935 RepID=UPI000F484037|nr:MULTISPECIES: flagellar hook capping FlgD N-terminal domain-containing protein [unclassified Enterobacter]ROP58300.1 flagellar basal-body rod modification protein FlgD [Enterobacter sp. BIGb0383]ROS06812.1 flagellar basal-body rod modification protein FlgD [Enterobacter sp. BIGb0359]